ncbi:MAG: NosD domain-containing protein [Candidatus Methanoperedens sp.]
MIGNIACGGRALRIAVGITMLVLVLAGGAGAMTFTVDDSGGADYTRIQDAINASSNGDTITVAAGTYNENVKVNKSVSLVGAGADVTIVQAANSINHVFNVTANTVNITGFKVTGTIGSGKAGLYFNGINYANISNNNISKNSYGLRLESSSNITFTNNMVYLNDGLGIFLESNSYNNLFANNTVRLNADHGVYLVEGYSLGVNTFINNTVDLNRGAGFSIYSFNNIIINNTINSNSDGILLIFSRYNTIENNNIQENNLFDIEVKAQSNLYGCNNIILNNTGSGNRPIKYFNSSINLENEVLSELILCNADNSNVRNITIKGSNTKNNNGLYVESTDNSNFTEINSSENVNGIYLEYSKNNNITNSNTNFGNNGITITYYSSNNIVTNNIANFNDGGGIIISHKSYENIITKNTASNNYIGINFGGSIQPGDVGTNIVTNNSFKENDQYDLFVGSACSDIVQNNIGSGDRLIKYFNSSIDLENDTISELILCNADNSNIYNITIEGSLIKKNNGLYVQSTDNSNFIEINSSNNYYGIRLEYSNNNTLINNIANSNSPYGIVFAYSKNNSFRGSEVSNNNLGILLTSDSSNNNLIGNNVNSNRGSGINMGSSGNNITWNNISNNSEGIFVTSGSTISNNYFNNTMNANIHWGLYYNAWNVTKTASSNIIDGPYLGGNFWANPSSTGFSQTCADANSDGICDTGYTVHINNIDYLPLAAPDTTNPTVVILSPANNTILNTSSINIIGNSSDTRSGIQKVEVQIDERAFDIATGTISWTYSISSLSDGLHRITARATDNATNIATTSINITVDTTPPAIITNLANVTYASTYINWSWTDPADIDFNHVEVYLDGIQKPNILAGVRYYNATGLMASTTHEISTRTVDNSGNVNATWKNHTATTASSPDTSAPASVTYLHNISYASTYINWIWTEPSDADFAKVMVYLDGVYKNDVLKGVNYYNAIVAPGTYTIGTRTVDTDGNINATMVKHTATTILPLIRFINGTVVDSVSKAVISGATVSTGSLSTLTNLSGFYSFSVTSGTYNLTANFEPTYYVNNTIMVSTVLSAEVVKDIELVKKPTGNITGSVTKA